MRELGAPEGGMLGGSNDMILMVLAFLLVFGLGCAAILVVPRFARRWRALNEVEHADSERRPADADLQPVGRHPAATPTIPTPAGERRARGADRPARRHAPALMEATTGVGPFARAPAAGAAAPATRRCRRRRARPPTGRETTRLLPWLLFGFVAMLWVIPFDSIMLPFGGPVDVTLDRPLLVLLAGIWLLSVRAVRRPLAAAAQRRSTGPSRPSP